ncbi:MAG TPA: hypothetical protein VIH35_08630, partial [Kiritimatiellia bacterium]
QQLNIKLQGEVPLDPRKDPAAMERALARNKDFAERVAKASLLLAQGHHDEACAIYDQLAKEYNFSFDAAPSLTMDDLAKPGPGCDVTEAAKRMVALATDFQKAYAEGRFTFEQQRQFSKDHETAAALATVDPAKACAEIDALRAKYGL